MSKAHQAEEATVEGRKRPFTHLRIWASPWIWVSSAIVAFVVHAIVLRTLFAQAGLPAAVVAGLIVVVVAKHLGPIGALSAWLWRRSPPGWKKSG